MKGFDTFIIGSIVMLFAWANEIAITKHIDSKFESIDKTDSLNRVIKIKAAEYDKLAKAYDKMFARAKEAEAYKEEHMINSAKLKMRLADDN